MTLHRTGLFIIRAWLERGSAKPLRAHVRLTNDVASGFSSEQTFAEVGEVSTAVEKWLEDILHDGRPT
jgi:hypothetical protein